MVDPNALPGFRQEVRDRIRSKLEAVLRGRERYDVFELIVEATVPPLPDIDTDWRARDAQTPAEPPSNQGRRERARGDHPERDGLAFGSPDELAVYDALVTLQRECPQERTFAIAPSAGVKLRDAGVKTPDFLVIGNGRAVVVEVDGRHHYGTTRKSELGRATRELGEFDTARSCFLEALQGLAPIGYRTAVAITLDNLAALENRLGHHIRALRLAGAAEALTESAGGQVPPEFADLPDPRQAARATLPGERIAQAWAQGRAMSLAEAVDYARTNGLLFTAMTGGARTG
jgi:tetratricopeptide (TPR) repeat protein